MDTLIQPQSASGQLNSLDRRDLPRQAVPAVIYAPWKDNLFKPCPVIECSDNGARVVLTGKVQRNQQIKLIVARGGNRRKTYARIAWTSSMTNGTTVVGLDFQRLDFSLAV